MGTSEEKAPTISKRKKEVRPDVPRKIDTKLVARYARFDSANMIILLVVYVQLLIYPALIPSLYFFLMGKYSLWLITSLVISLIALVINWMGVYNSSGKDVDVWSFSNTSGYFFGSVKWKRLRELMEMVDQYNALSDAMNQFDHGLNGIQNIEEEKWIEVVNILIQFRKKLLKALAMDRAQRQVKGDVFRLPSRLFDDDEALDRIVGSEEESKELQAILKELE